MTVQELQDLKHEKQQLRQTCEQQEQALQEMGLHLSQSVLLILLPSFNVKSHTMSYTEVVVIFCQRSKLKMEDFKEVNKALKVKKKSE